METIYVYNEGGQAYIDGKPKVAPDFVVCKGEECYLDHWWKKEWIRGYDGYAKKYPKWHDGDFQKNRSVNLEKA